PFLEPQAFAALLTAFMPLLMSGVESLSGAPGSVLPPELPPDEPDFLGLLPPHLLGSRMHSTDGESLPFLVSLGSVLVGTSAALLPPPPPPEERRVLRPFLLVRPPLPSSSVSSSAAA